MSLDEIKREIAQLNDPDLLALLDEVSNELKKRNTILGPANTDVRKENIQQGLKVLLETIAKVST